MGKGTRKDKNTLKQFLDNPYRQTEHVSKDPPLVKASFTRKTQASPAIQHRTPMQSDALADKVNKLLDKQASNPLIIQQLKRTDSLFDKVAVSHTYVQHTMRQASGMFKLKEPLGEEEPDEKQ